MTCISVTPGRIGRASDMGVMKNPFPFSEGDIEASNNFIGTLDFATGERQRQVQENLPLEMAPIVWLKNDEDLNTFEELWDINDRPDETMRLISEDWLQKQYASERPLDCVYAEELLDINDKPDETMTLIFGDWLQKHPLDFVSAEKIAKETASQINKELEQIKAEAEVVAAKTIPVKPKRTILSKVKTVLKKAEDFLGKIPGQNYTDYRTLRVTV
jgi:hypothetical protein